MVKIVKNQKSGEVFTPNTRISTDGIERGFYVCESTELTMEGGFIKKNKVTALLTLPTQLAQELDWKEGHKLSGKIVTNESHVPFYENQSAKINPTTQADVLVNGKKVYRQSNYTDNMSLTSSLIIASPVQQADAVTILPTSFGSTLNK